MKSLYRLLAELKGLAIGHQLHVIRADQSYRTRVLKKQLDDKRRCDERAAYALKVARRQKGMTAFEHKLNQSVNHKW